jgi:hypothetical protein
MISYWVGKPTWEGPVVGIKRGASMEFCWVEFSAGAFGGRDRGDSGGLKAEAAPPSGRQRERCFT